MVGGRGGKIRTSDCVFFSPEKSENCNKMTLLFDTIFNSKTQLYNSQGKISSDRKSLPSDIRNFLR